MAQGQVRRCRGRSCPTGMAEMLNDPDQGRAQRAMKAMLGMKKIDVAALHAAADGRSDSVLSVERTHPS